MLAEEEAIELTRRGRPSISVRDAEQAIAFAEREREFWGWLAEDINEMHPSVAQALGRYRGKIWTRLTAAAASWKAGGPGARDGFKSNLTNYYSIPGMLCSTDTEAVAIRELANLNPLTARVALATLQGAVPFSDNGFFTAQPEHIVGVARGLALAAGLAPFSPGEREAAFDRLRLEANASLSAFRSDTSAAKAHAETEAQRFSHDASIGESNRQEGYEKAELRRAEDFESLRASLQQTRDFYEKQMEVQGAVRYWENRAQSHRLSSRITLVVLAVFTAAAVVSLFWLYASAAAHLPDSLTGPLPLASLFKTTAFALLMTTIVFWIGRVLLRVFLSDRHLATDAEERRTMIMTYLALTRKKTLSDEDKKLILPSIFRAGSDGIVKEEAAPDTAFAALVGSVLKR